MSTVASGTSRGDLAPSQRAAAAWRSPFLIRVAKAIHKGHRWHLESDEPDATGGWDDAHRRRMLSYVYERDGGRCGLCAGETKIKGAQIEHVVPKVFVLLDVGKNGKTEPGTQYRLSAFDGAGSVS